MCACSHSYVSLTRDAIVCADCGMALDVARYPAPPLPVLMGITLRRVDTALRPVAVPRVHLLHEPTRLRQEPLQIAAQIQQRIAPAAPVIRPWCDIIAPLIALVFVMSVVLGVAAALDVVGVSPRGLGLLAIPLAGAIWAEATWLEGRWAVGLLGMLLWDAVLWTLAVAPFLVHS